MFILIDKPKGITSHDVIYRLRRLTNEKRIGHGGTLDPNATGLLIVGIGRESTKKLGSLTTGTNKTYIAEVILGEERETDDIEGEVVKKGKGKAPSLEEVTLELKKFEGEQTQIPPVYSAIKFQGKKAYELARKGKEITMEPRTVTIHNIKLLSYKFPKLEIECEVSSGTYIRALARDLGRSLGILGYLGELRRTKVGEFAVENATQLDKLTKDNWKEKTLEIVI